MMLKICFILAVAHGCLTAVVSGAACYPPMFGCAVCDPDDVTQCIATCLPYCLTCDNTTTCNSCQPFHYVNIDGGCSECTVENCVTCDEDPDICVECVSGYNPNAEGQCVEECTVENCVTCDEDPDICVECVSEYNPNAEGQCVEECTVENCVTCDEDPDICVECASEYNPNAEGQCVEACIDENCVQCDYYGSFCTTCVNGYNPNAYGQCVKGNPCNPPIPGCNLCDVEGSCVIECLPGCLECSDFSSSCTECKLGFGMVDHIFTSTCQKCLDQHCLKCDYDPDNCSSCASGYSEDITGKCVAITGCGCGEWECNDGQCINEDSLCDTKLDCDDESDESDSQCGAGGTLMTVLIAQIQLAEQLG